MCYLIFCWSAMKVCIKKSFKTVCGKASGKLVQQSIEGAKNKTKLIVYSGQKK